MFGSDRTRTCLGVVLLGCALLLWDESGANSADGLVPALVGILPGRAAETGLSLGDLRDLPWHTVRTRNLYNDREVTYAGPLMRDVIAALGLSGASVVRCTALNEYSVDIPTTDFQRWNVILAMEADGTPLSPRESGPLWVIYPQSEHPELIASAYNQRLIWQLIRIEAF